MPPPLVVRHDAAIDLGAFCHLGYRVRQLESNCASPIKNSSRLAYFPA